MTKRHCKYCNGEVEEIVGGAYAHVRNDNLCNSKVEHKMGGPFATIIHSRCLSKKETYVKEDKPDV